MRFRRIIFQERKSTRLRESPQWKEHRWLDRLGNPFSDMVRFCQILLTTNGAGLMFSAASDVTSGGSDALGRPSKEWYKDHRPRYCCPLRAPTTEQTNADTPTWSTTKWPQHNWTSQTIGLRERCSKVGPISPDTNPRACVKALQPR